jgi:23S rRNA (cytosine1962-C5)-methyltransferase
VRDLWYKYFVMYKTIKLTQGKERTATLRHPWIFSGALETKPTGISNGEIVQVVDAANLILGVGTYSENSMIAIRLFDFKDAQLNEEWFVEKIKEAAEKRELLGYGKEKDITGYRVVFSEADGIPGLVVDKFEDVLVMQISTLGTRNLKPLIVNALVKVLKPKAIVLKEVVSARNEESLEEKGEVVYGKLPAKINFYENGHKFFCDPVKGQKTGFYLDQKDLRNEIAKYSKGKKVLNLFSYSGAASVYVLKNGAKSVLNVDSSKEALLWAKTNATLNKVVSTKSKNECDDIFQWLAKKTEPEYDMVIMDPPALIKTFKDKESGQKAYHFLNRAALRLIKKGGIFVTSSCSHFFTDEELEITLRRASVQVGVKLTVLKKVLQSPDHPISVYFPESAYLKSYICLVS